MIMIRINLLGIAPTPIAKAAGPPPTTALMAGVFVGAAVVASLVVGLFYMVWSKAVKDQEKLLKKENDRKAELAGVEAQNKRYQLYLAQLETRMNTIEALQNSRVGPVEVMTVLGNTVNRTTDLYLITVTPGGNRLAIRGQSNSVESIAAFIAALKATDNFSDVQLRQYYQDDQEKRLSYKFNLDFAVKAPAAATATPAAQPGAPAGGPPPRRAGL